MSRTGLKNSLVARLARCEARRGKQAKKPEAYPLRYAEDDFAKFDEVAARIPSTGAEDVFETGSNRSPGSGSRRTLIVRSLLGVALVCAVLYCVSTGDLVSALTQVSLGDVVILIALSVVLIAVSVCKWQLFLRHLGIAPSFAKLFGLYLVGYFVNVFTPSFVGGDVVRSLALGRQVNRARAVSATVLERYTGIVAMLCMALIACCVSNVVTQEIVLVVVAAVVGCAVGTWLLFAGWLNRFARRVGLPAKLTKTFDAVHEGLVWGVRDRGLLIKAFALSVSFHLLTVVNTAAVGAAVGWSEIPWGGLLVVVPLILLIGAVPISPQGLGIQEGAFVFFLHSVGATTGQALAIALVLRAKSYLLALCGGIIWLLNHKRWQGQEGSPTSKNS